jgi:lipopolysaccharide transport system permease protein
MQQTKETIHVYEPHQKLKENFFKTWWVMLKNMIGSKELIMQLFRRDFFAIYKTSFIGVGWILISPIIGIISWILLNSSGILEPGDVGIPYPAYVLISSSIWGLFMGFVSSSQGTLGIAKGFITQVDFPHEALLIKQLLDQFVNYMITFIFNLGVLILFGVELQVYVLIFPILMLPLLFLGSGIGLIIGVVSIVALDIGKIFSRLLGLALYITPVIYSSETSDETLNTIIKYNPLTYIIGGVRDLIVYGEYEHMDIFLIIGLATFAFFLMALRLFYVSEEQVIEKML